LEGLVGVATGLAAADVSAAFIALAEPELPGAYRLAGFLLRDAVEAEDATQEALLKAWLAFVLGVRGIPAQQSVLAEDPQLAGPYVRLVG
jgi:hypothetical protein